MVLEAIIANLGGVFRWLILDLDGFSSLILPKSVEFLTIQRMAPHRDLKFGHEFAMTSL